MGQSVTALREELRKEKEEKRQELEERLPVMEKMIELRLEAQKDSMLNGERHDQEIDTGTIVSLHKMVYIRLQHHESGDISHGIDEFFSGDIIGGLKTIVKMGAETVLENESTGEYETTDMFIVWTSNALLRCDTYYYRWNFASKGVIEDISGVTGVPFVKRVIDLTKTDPQVLTWAITRMADRLNNAHPKPEKPVDPNELVGDALKVLEKVVEFQAKIKAKEAGGKPE